MGATTTKTNDLHLSTAAAPRRGFRPLVNIQSARVVKIQSARTSIEKIAIASALEFFENRGYRVQQVSASRHPDHVGCDLVIEKNGRHQTIEVKGTSNEWKIPDLYGSEVRNGALTADALLLVYVVDEQAATFCLIPRDEIKPEEFRERRGYRIVEGVKCAARLQKHIQTLVPQSDSAQ